MRLPSGTNPPWRRPASGRKHSGMVIAIVLVVGATIGAVLAESVGIGYALTAVVLLAWPAAVLYSMRDRAGRTRAVSVMPAHMAAAKPHSRPTHRPPARHTPMLRRVK